MQNNSIYRSTTTLSTLLVAIVVFSHTLQISARNGRQNMIPNGGVNRCANCHINPGGGGTRTPFGEAVYAALGSVPRPANFPFWGPDLADGDADGDRISNGTELADGDGLWQPGSPNPPGPVTNPWNL